MQHHSFDGQPIYNTKWGYDGSIKQRPSANIQYSLKLICQQTTGLKNVTENILVDDDDNKRQNNNNNNNISNSYWHDTPQAYQY